MQERRHLLVGCLMSIALLVGVGGSGAGGAAEAGPATEDKAGRAKAGSSKKGAEKKATPLSRQAEKAASKAAQARLATRKLHDLPWHGGWKAAVTTNLREPKSARPIFFLRILGDLAGST